MNKFKPGTIIKTAVSMGLMRMPPFGRPRPDCFLDEVDRMKHDQIMSEAVKIRNKQSTLTKSQRDRVLFFEAFFLDLAKKEAAAKAQPKRRKKMSINGVEVTFLDCLMFILVINGVVGLILWGIYFIRNLKG